MSCPHIACSQRCISAGKSDMRAAARGRDVPGKASGPGWPRGERGCAGAAPRVAGRGAG